MSGLVVRTLKRIGKAMRTYVATGQFRAAPGPIIERFFAGKDCFFVQVGAADGRDALHQLIEANPRWTGLFIEPQEEFLSKLVARYGATGRFAFEQIAIAGTAGMQPFYFVPQD